MIFARRQTFILSLLLVCSMFFAPLAQELYAESLFTKLKNKATSFISKTVEKYTSRDYLVDKASNVIAKKIVGTPVKFATAALGMAIGTAIGGPVGAALGAYLGNKIGEHTSSIVGKPIVANIINDTIDNDGTLNVKTIYNACKSVDMPSLACDTTGAIVGDIVGSALGGMLGAAITVCVGGGTILPIIGTLTFATLGSKYGEKLGNWIGQKFGENAFNNGYKVLTGIDRTEDQSAGKNAIVATIDSVKNVDKKEVARNTTGEVVGDVIGSALGTIAGATLTALSGCGVLTPILGSLNLTKLGEKWGSKLGSNIGNKIGTKFFDKSEEVLTGHSNNTKTENKTGLSDADAVYQAYMVAYENYANALSDKNATSEYKLKMQQEYNACYEMYRKMVSEVK